MKTQTPRSCKHAWATRHEIVLPATDSDDHAELVNTCYAQAPARGVCHHCRPGLRPAFFPPVTARLATRGKCNGTSLLAEHPVHSAPISAAPPAHRHTPVES